MVVMTASFFAICYYCAKKTLQYHCVRDQYQPSGMSPLKEGEPMPHDMNALMWYDL